MDYTEWADEYLNSAKDIQRKIDEIKQSIKRREVKHSDLPSTYRRIAALECMRNDCEYSANRIIKYAH